MRSLLPLAALALASCATTDARTVRIDSLCRNEGDTFIANIPGTQFRCVWSQGRWQLNIEAVPEASYERYRTRHQEQSK